MSDMATRTMSIAIKKGKSGMYFATSEDEPTFFLAQPSREALIAALPWALESTVRDVHHQDVTALPENVPSRGDVTMKIVARAQLAAWAREHCL